MNIGDLVQSKRTGKIGVVTKLDTQYVNYCYVQFHDKTYTTHTSNLKALEKQ